MQTSRQVSGRTLARVEALYIANTSPSLQVHWWVLQWDVEPSRSLTTPPSQMSVFPVHSLLLDEVIVFGTTASSSYADPVDEVLGSQMVVDGDESFVSDSSVVVGA